MYLNCIQVTMPLTVMEWAVRARGARPQAAGPTPETPTEAPPPEAQWVTAKRPGVPRKDDPGCEWVKSESIHESLIIQNNCPACVCDVSPS